MGFFGYSQSTLAQSITILWISLYWGIMITDLMRGFINRFTSSFFLIFFSSCFSKSFCNPSMKSMNSPHRDLKFYSSSLSPYRDLKLYSSSLNFYFEYSFFTLSRKSCWLSSISKSPNLSWKLMPLYIAFKNWTLWFYNCSPSSNTNDKSYSNIIFNSLANFLPLDY